jgi:hypothetical protein
MIYENFRKRKLVQEGVGGLRIYVVKAEGKLKSEEISHIKFEVQPARGEIARIIDTNKHNDRQYE